MIILDTDVVSELMRATPPHPTPGCPQLDQSRWRCANPQGAP